MPVKHALEEMIVQEEGMESVDRVGIRFGGGRDCHSARSAQVDAKGRIRSA